MPETPEDRQELERQDNAFLVAQCRDAVMGKVHAALHDASSDTMSDDEVWQQLCTQTHHGNFVLAHWEHVQRSMRDPAKINACMSMLANICTGNNEEENVLVADMLLRYDGDLLALRHIAYVLNGVFAHATRYQQECLLDRLEPVIRDPSNTYYLRFFLRSPKRYKTTLELLKPQWQAAKEQPTNGSLRYLEEGFNSTFSTVRFAAKQALSDMLPPGIDAEVLLQSWKGAPYGVASNMYALLQLERERRGKGIVKALFEEFGICQFARYPVEVLVRQFDTRDTHEPYGLFAIGNDDHNSAFKHLDAIADEVAKETQERDTLLRIVEFRSPQSLARRLLSLRRRYATDAPEGHGHRIKFCLLGAHGSEHAIHPGRDISTSHMLDERAQALLESCMEESAWIVLDSCSTGKADAGVAAVLSQRGLRTVGPTTDAGIYRLDVEDDPRTGIRIVPRYAEGESAAFENGKRATS